MQDKSTQTIEQAEALGLDVMRVYFESRRCTYTFCNVSAKAYTVRAVLCVFLRLSVAGVVCRL